MQKPPGANRRADVRTWYLYTTGIGSRAVSLPKRNPLRSPRLYGDSGSFRRLGRTAIPATMAGCCSIGHRPTGVGSRAIIAQGTAGRNLTALCSHATLRLRCGQADRPGWTIRRNARMAEREPGEVRWAGRLWLLALIAVVLAVVILAVIWPRSMAWRAPLATATPGTPNPNLYVIPTLLPPSPTPPPVPPTIGPVFPTAAPSPPTTPPSPSVPAATPTP